MLKKASKNNATARADSSPLFVRGGSQKRLEVRKKNRWRIPWAIEHQKVSTINDGNSSKKRKRQSMNHF